MVAELEKIHCDDNGGFRAEYISEPTGFWHFHPEYEIVLSTEDGGTRIVGDSVELFGKYDLVFIGGNVPHCWNYYRKGSGAPEYRCISLHFRIESIGEALLSQHELHSVRELLVESERGIAFSVDDAVKVEPFLVNMVQSRGIDKMISFFNIIRLMSASEKRTFLCSDNYKQVFDERGNKRMTDVYNYIRENYHQPVTLEKVSRVARMGPISFSRYFKKNCGAGFIEYVNRVRMNKACYLLRETMYHINEIASECGFSSISNFNKHFRKLESLSPSEYRAQFK